MNAQDAMFLRSAVAKIAAAEEGESVDLDENEFESWIVAVQTPVRNLALLQ